MGKEAKTKSQVQGIGELELIIEFMEKRMMFKENSILFRALEM